MRPLGSLLCGMIAVIGCAAAIPAWWLNDHVGDPDGFVQLMGPVTVDDELHESLAEEVAEHIVTGTDAPDTVSEPLESATIRTIRAVATTTQFTALWERVLLASHAATLDDTEQSRMQLDIAPLAEYVTEQIDGIGGVQLSAPSSARVPISTRSHPVIFDFVRHAAGLQWWAAAMSVVSGAAAVWLARSRAGAVLLLALSVLAVVALFKLMVDQSVPAALAAGSADSQLAHHLISAASRQIATSVHEMLTYIGFAGVGTAAIAGGWRLARPPQRAARQPAP